LDAHPLAVEPQLLRATVLESVRLWPTTPAVLRDATEATEWEDGTLPAGAGILIFSSLFHRDEERLPYANRFMPDLWRGGDPASEWPLVPFSEGPVECPGKNLVLLTTSTLLSHLLARARFRQAGAVQLAAGKPLPATFSPFRLAFELESAQA
jgi:cytochrome P450